jgi:uncharacterized protein YkwD
MSSASRQETSGRPPSGRHRRAGSSGLTALAVAVVLVLIVAGAMFSPKLLGWPPPSGVGAAGAPSTVAAPPTTRPATRSATPPPTTSAPTPTPTRTPRRTTPPINAVESFENEVPSLTNAERHDAGCSALRLDTRLRTAARRHSAEMARFGYFSHTGQNGSDPGRRMRDAGYPTSGGWAENIARGYPDPASVMDGWMNSPGHRANILNCSLRALGVGVVRSQGGRVYWTQDFGAR